MLHPSPHLSAIQTCIKCIYFQNGRKILSSANSALYDLFPYMRSGSPASFFHKAARVEVVLLLMGGWAVVWWAISHHYGM